MTCALAGASVVIHCRSSLEKANRVYESIVSAGGEAAVIAADLSGSEQRLDFLQRCIDGGRVDGLVNNAGADLLTTSLRNAPYETRLNALLHTDVGATIELSREFGRRFFEAGQGAILNIGWDQSDRGMEGESGELFATAKNAVMGFTRSLACSLAPKVRVNCIAPGWIKTSWGEHASDYWQQRVLSETPLKRWGEPQDIANMARFLLSDEASYITGQVINVNGGAVR